MIKLLPVLLLFIIGFILDACDDKNTKKTADLQHEHILAKDSIVQTPKAQKELIIEKAFLYDEHTLQDTYPYKDTVRMFQWVKIRSYLSMVDSLRELSASWGILQNHRNKNGEAPLVKIHQRNEYNRIADAFKIERYQGTPLYQPNDSMTPERYGLDGSLVRIIAAEDSSDFIKVATVFFEGEWLIPTKYVKLITDTILFNKVIFVDRTNQNITSLEKVGAKWLVRSMNPATTGLHHPPLMQATPLGIFVVQEKKEKMIYLIDGTNQKGGFAPYANRFCSGGYIHGVPVNLPRTATIEFSSTLGTTPRSHMCVRNATSHSKFIYDWAPVEQVLVIVLE